jgi:hypothetical protein
MHIIEHIVEKQWVELIMKPVCDILNGSDWKDTFRDAQSVIEWDKQLKTRRDGPLSRNFAARVLDPLILFINGKNDENPVDILKAAQFGSVPSGSGGPSTPGRGGGNAQTAASLPTKSSRQKKKGQYFTAIPASEADWSFK